MNKQITRTTKHVPNCPCILEGAHSQRRSGVVTLVLLLLLVGVAPPLTTGFLASVFSPLLSTLVFPLVLSHSFAVTTLFAHYSRLFPLVNYPSAVWPLESDALQKPDPTVNPSLTMMTEQSKGYSHVYYGVGLRWSANCWMLQESLARSVNCCSSTRSLDGLDTAAKPHFVLLSKSSWLQ